MPRSTQILSKAVLSSAFLIRALIRTGHQCEDVECCCEFDCGRGIAVEAQRLDIRRGAHGLYKAKRLSEFDPVEDPRWQVYHVLDFHA